MKVKIVNKKLTEIKADCEVVLVINKKTKHKWVKDQAAMKAENFQAKPDEILYLPHKSKLYIGVESLEAENIRLAMAKAVAQIKKKCASIKIGLYGQDSARAIAEGLVLGSYGFHEYKSKPEKSRLKQAVISVENYENPALDYQAAKKAVERAMIVSQAVNYARDIINQPPAEMTPVRMAEEARKLAKDSRLKVRIMGEKFLEEQGMGAFLAVSRASSFPPQLIHFHYAPAKPLFKVAVVGKGLTYDTGGLSLKPSGSMTAMKADKSGASAVFGIMKAASQLGAPIEIHGIAGVTENAIGRDAYRPDDILRAKNGKTIEVTNTDAEGRLVLADCLCYAQEQKPDYIIDLATLTGACVVALGEYTIGVMGYDRELRRLVMEAAHRSGELSANLPFNRYLKRMLKSNIADLVNAPKERWGGAITAAMFLGEFIEKSNQDKWIHLDIAGPAYNSKAWGYNPAGGSGAGVRTVIELMAALEKQA